MQIKQFLPSTVRALCVLAFSLVSFWAAAHADNVRFPLGAGFIDVTKAPYNAIPNDGLDDTVAIQAAISANVDASSALTRMIYLPNGVYNLSDTLYWRKANPSGTDPSGGWGAYLRLQGQSRAGTILKLQDGASMFGDPMMPQAVIYPASHYDGSVGFDPDTGNGNKAFRNGISNLTIDVGSNNPGAIGIDYLANNQGAIRDVTIKSSDASKRGIAGISLKRSWPGPCILKNVSVDGFNYGVDMMHSQYSVTFERLTLTNQKTAGIHNLHNALWFNDLTSTNAVPVIHSEGNQSLVVVNTGRITGTTGASTQYALNNVAGKMWVRKTSTSGYKKPILNRGTEINYANNTEWISDAIASVFPSPQHSLTLGNGSGSYVDAPGYFDSNLANWQAIDASAADDTPAIQAAMNSGKSTVYFPQATYSISSTVTIPSTVRHVVGMGSFVGMTPTHIFGNAAAPQPMFKFQGANSVLMEDFYLKGQVVGTAPLLAGTVCVMHSGTGSLTLRDCLLSGKKFAFQNQAPSVGSLGVLFIENVGGPSWRFEVPQQIWARQLNAEYADESMIYNNGGQLWILGLKTEGAQTAIETAGGGSTELMGGFLYPLDTAASTFPAFINHESRVSLIFVSKADATNKNYTTFVRETRGGVTNNYTLTPNFRVMVPLYVGYP